MAHDVLTRADAWRLLDEIRADDRALWAGEPAELEHAWRAISARRDSSHKLWTDDYLAAFAQCAGLTVTTLDGRFESRYPSVKTNTLT